MKILSTTAIAAAMFAATAVCHAGTTYTFNFMLTGDQEVPAVDTTGIGNATVTLDTFTLMLNWDVTYSDLLSDTTAAHFHGPAMPGMNAGIQVNIGDSGPLGGTSGFFQGSTTITEDQAQEILDGLWYINIHTTGNPGGEIRGQVVPAPGALALLGLAGLAGTQRRRR